MLSPPYTQLLRNSLRVGYGAEFLNWTFQFSSYDHQNVFGECSNTFKTFVTSVFLYFTWKFFKSIFSKPVSIFSCSSRALITKYSRMTRLSLKNGSSLRLMKNNLFYTSYDVTFFSSLLPWMFKTFQICIWMLYDAQKKFESIWNWKLHQNVRNFWQCFEYLMKFLESLD